MNTKPVVRDRAWVEREYNREKYPRLLKAAESVLSSSERSFARAVGQIIDCERGIMALDDKHSIISDGKILNLPFPLASAAIAGATTHLLASSANPKTETVVELGAGWGRNLFMLHLSGLLPRRAHYFALEFAATARMTAGLVAPLDPGLSFTAADFDYHAPSYEMIPTGEAPALLATIHSVEQIPELKPEVFTKLIARLPNLSGLHIEPVGFQLRADDAHAAYAAKNAYNRNLWSVLQSLAHDGVIEIVDTRVDFMGLNPKNPSTIIRWRAQAR